MNKIEAIRIIVDCAKIYSKNLENKNLLFISFIDEKFNYFEAKFIPGNYKHLTGVVTNKKISADFFYKKCLNDRLSLADFEFKTDGTTPLKLSVLPYLMEIYKNSKITGDFNGSKIKLKSDKITGTISACLGFKKQSEIYVPVTTLKEDTRNLIQSNERIIAILSKNIKDRKYDCLNYIVKEFINTRKEVLPIELLKKIDTKNTKCSFEKVFVKS